MLAIYRKHTGRDAVPHQQSNEAWVIAGRRSGKSLISALIAVYLACFREYGDVLAPGEVGTIMVIASDRRLARVVFGFINGFLDSVAMLRAMVSSRTQESIALTNRVRIEVHTASLRAVRGYKVIAAILDEVPFYRTGDSANPDQEILTALRPAMAEVPNGLLRAVVSYHVTEST